MINTIDQDRCTGCGTCFKSCSLDVFRIDPWQHSLSPCMAACPAGTNIRAYNSLVQQGRLDEAARVLTERNPFPSLTGRICFRPCEKQCARGGVDAPVNINALEQYLGDLDEPEQRPAVRHVEKAAVVGAGPAGLSCALYLARLGYPVTVFDALPEPGGMLRYGIPAYRLPNHVIERQIRRLESLGVRFACSTRVGEGGDVTLETLRRRGYRAFLVAPGAGLSRRLDIDGARLPGVHWGVEFLRGVRMDRIRAVSGRVVVVGGGDVAIDAAITCRRLGAASVAMVSLESREELPAFPHNQADALAEGVVFHCGWGPVRVEGEAGVTGLTVQRCLAVKDGEGRFAPRFDAGERRTFEADMVVFAIGQASDLAPFAKDVALRNGRVIDVEPVTFATSAPDVFAAGDAATGPASAIQAMAAGREAAVSMDRWLRGAQVLANRADRPPLVENLPGENIMPLPRNDRGTVADAPAFGERRKTLSLDRVLAESMRCMTCGARASIAYNDDCMTCYTCELRCPAGAINVHPFKEPLPRTLELPCEG